MKNVQEMVAAIHNLNQRTRQLEANQQVLKATIEKLQFRVQELEEEHEELTSAGGEEPDDDGVIDVEQ